MQRLLIAAAFVLAFTASAAAQVSLVRDGRSSSRIVLQEGALPTREGAQLLQRFIGEATGCTLPIVEGTPRRGDIVLGGPAPAGVTEDGFRLSATDGFVRITGSGKGVSYGAVTFLERFLGMDYWGRDEYCVPACRELTVPAVDFIDNPTFAFRQTQNYAMRGDPVYKLWYRLEEPAEAFAGGWWVHTFNRILPYEKYGSTHPEYYAWYNGKRHPGSGSQWCFADPGLLETVCAVLDSVFRAHPDLDIVCASQNDGNDTYCRCPACAAADAEDGTHAGSLLRFVNAVADRFPDKRIATLAYLYTMDAPRVTRPRDNVVIMLCDIDCMREVPLTDNASGRVFMKALEGWSAVTRTLYVWDYGINFDCYLSPFPNFSVLKRNMEIFRDHHVKMHFSQIGGSRGGDFSEMRSYLASKLMWNASADLDSLEHHFLRSYYGDAGPYLYQYIQLLEGSLLGSGKRLWIYDTPISHKDGMLNPHLMKRYNALFDAAEAAVAADSAFLARVQRTRVPLQYSALEIARTDPEMDREQALQDLALFEARCRQFGVNDIDERRSNTFEYVRLYRERYIGNASSSLAYGKPVRFTIAPSPAYRQLGETALTDGLYGGLSFNESWVGWEGIDADFTIDLGSVQTVHSISTDFLVKIGAWILMPLSVSYSYSVDGETFTPWERIDIPLSRDGAVRFVPVTAEAPSGLDTRFLRVQVEGTKECPEWHYGVGNPSWFFCDEVVVN